MDVDVDVLYCDLREDGLLFLLSQLDRTKVVLRHLPPSISKASLLHHLHSVFAGRYHWLLFRPPNNDRQKHSFCRAYVEFKRAEDVVEFAEFFQGRLFVNEKGIQFKTMVEYAPSQRVPKLWSKKDGREGTIDKDPEYLKFLEFLAKPAEYLPSAEIQLERREAERAGAGKDPPIITPLMDFVRQKRAAKGGSRRSLSNGKLTRKGSGSSAGSSNSTLTKRGADKRRNLTKMYVLRDAVKNTTVRDETKCILVAKRDNQLLSDKSTLSSIAGADVLEESGKKKILLLKGKETENQGSEIAGGRIVKSILQNKNTRQNHSLRVHCDLPIQASGMEKDKRHPSSQHGQLGLRDTNGASNYKIVGNDMHGFRSEKAEKRRRNKDRPDRGVWAPRHRPDGSSANDESLSLSTASRQARVLESLEGSPGDMKYETTNARIGEVKTPGNGCSSPSAVDNGFHKHLGRRGPKDADGSPVTSEGKHSKRGGASGYGSHEKQVWVQKSTSGS